MATTVVTGDDENNANSDQHQVKWRRRASECGDENEAEQREKETMERRRGGTLLGNAVPVHAAMRLQKKTK